MFAIPSRAGRAGSAPLSARSEAGLTLIEVLVGALIAIAIASATAKALITGSHFSGDQSSRSQGHALAAQDQERLRGLSDQQLNGFNQTRTVTFASGSTFTVASLATFLDATGASSCTSTAAAYYKIKSTVSWTENYTSRPAKIVEESIVSRPVSGDLLTQVTDQTLQPLQGVAVRGVGPSVQSGATDDNGCVVFAGLIPGLYTVTLTDQNYVDQDGNALPLNLTTTVTSTGIANPRPSGVHIGLPGSVVGTFTTGMTGVGAEADTLSWLGNGATLLMSGYKSSTPLSAMASAITTNALFPFDVSATSPASYTNNYGVWAGACLQMEPPTGVNRVTVGSGQTNQPLSVQEAPLNVATVKYNNGTTTVAVKPAHIKLTFSSTAGTACSDSWYPTVTSSTTEPANGWLANPGQPFASTATTGATASAASSSGSPQTGTYTMCADYVDTSTHVSYKTSTATFTNTSLTSLNAVPSLTITKTTSGTC